MANQGIYARYVKRALDIICSLSAIIVFSWLYIILAILVRIKLGSPIIFAQERPGKNEKIFKLYKFRTMTDQRDENGDLLPDDVRLTKFGKMLRNTSLDELPEAFNILRGEMSIVGPRPQLIRDMLYMSDEQRRRHFVTPGLSGWAQVNGRNAVSWDTKLKYDLEYVNKGISFWWDLKIVILTVKKAFIKQEGISEEGMETASDFGDFLLKNKRISKQEYEQKQLEAKKILEDYRKGIL